MTLKFDLGRISSRLIGVVLLFILMLSAVVYADTAQDKKSELEAQIARLEKEAADIDKNIQETQAAAHTLTNEISLFNQEIKQRQIDIKRLNLVIQKTQADIDAAAESIKIMSASIEKQRMALGASLLILSSYEQDNLLTVLLKNNRLSDFFTALYNFNLIQGNIQEALAGLRQDRKDLENKKAELADFQEEQQKLKALKQTEERALAGKKKEKDELLRLTKGKEALFQQLLQNKKRDIAVLKTQLFYLEKTGITAEDAVKYADLAAKRTGIRTAFLLALLEVETGKQFEDGQFSVGTNIGTGNWQRDLYQCYINLGKRSAAESEKNAFFSITSKLNLDPDRMPVSRKPSYGCGGAMGPAQFLPTTWLRFEDRVAELTGHNPPNPWNIEDSFTAAAIFLADAGASSQTQAGEIAAAKTYISGNANCTKYICRSYSSRIISLARDIDRVL
jgi:peptidoglycan hydrolase CwlO-like protein